MAPIQHIGLPPFVLLSVGVATGCADGHMVETYLAKGLASQLLDHDQCQQL